MMLTVIFSGVSKWMLWFSSNGLLMMGSCVFCLFLAHMNSFDAVK